MPPVVQVHRVGPSGRIGVVAMDHPPVNALSLVLRQGLLAAFDELGADARVQAIVLHGRGRGFSAGGDIKEFGTPAAVAEPGVSSALHPAIERCPKPVVAAIHGMCLGGGLETALACHHRVGSRSAQVSLPEVALGLFPLSGTQRLPRLLGLAGAARFIAEGRRFNAADWPVLFDLLVDEAHEAGVLARAVAFAGQLDPHAPHPLLRDRPVPGPHGAAELAPWLHHESAAVRAATQAVQAAAGADFETGLAQARRLYDALYRSDAFQHHLPTVPKSTLRDAT